MKIPKVRKKLNRIELITHEFYKKNQLVYSKLLKSSHLKEDISGDIDGYILRNYNYILILLIVRVFYPELIDDIKLQESLRCIGFDWNKYITESDLELRITSGVTPRLKTKNCNVSFVKIEDSDKLILNCCEIPQIQSPTFNLKNN